MHLFINIIPRYIYFNLYINIFILHVFCNRLTVYLNTYVYIEYLHMFSILIIIYREIHV